MTVPDIYAAELELFGVPSAAVATTAAQNRAVIDINSAIQQMQDAGEDFYGREEVIVDLVAATEIYTLAKTVQSVLDDAILSDGTTLTKLGSYGQLRQFAQIFQGALTNTSANGKPIAYFVEPVRDTDGTTGVDDSVLIRVHVLPAPDTASAALNLVLGVINQAAVIVAGDLTNAAKKIPIPHKYVESIFLPLLRWNATSSYLFAQKDMLDRYREDYRRALRLLNKADPRELDEKPLEEVAAQPGRAAA